MGLLEFLRGYDEDEQFASNGRVLLAYLRDAMDPFRGKDVAVELYWEPDYRNHRVEVSIKSLPWFKFKYSFTQDTVLSLYDPNVIFQEIGLAIRDYWRSIPRVEPEDNIILSEN